MLYLYVLQEIQTFAKGMNRWKTNSTTKNYADITELTLEILDGVIGRIEIWHGSYRYKPSKVIQFY